VGRRENRDLGKGEGTVSGSPHTKREGHPGKLHYMGVKSWQVENYLVSSPRKTSGKKEVEES